MMMNFYVYTDLYTPVVVVVVVRFFLDKHFFWVKNKHCFFLY